MMSYGSFTRAAWSRVALRRLPLLALLVALLATAACDKVPLLAPSNSAITMSAASTTLSSGGSTEVQAYVRESSGTPVQNGTTVRFTVNLGRVDPVEAQTHNGVATTTFHADGASGVAQVRASSGGASGGTGDSATNLVQITVGTAAVAESGIAVRANPSNVPASGGTVDVIATVVGSNNTALSGIPVSFSTNRGSLSASTATTDAAGQARVQLTTNRESTVTASVGSRSGTITIGVNAAATVTLTASSSPVAGQPLTLTVTPTTGTAPRVVIDWGDNDRTDLGIVAAERRVTHTYNNAGGYTIAATSTDGSETTNTAIGVTIANRPSPTVTASTSTPAAGANVAFTVTPTTSGAGIRNVQIDFGDGSAAVELGSITTATTVNHAFGSAGSYTVRVTQTDNSGNDTSSVIVIRVT